MGPVPGPRAGKPELLEYIALRACLQDWGSYLAAALTHGTALSAEEVAAFVRPYQDVVPGLLDLLDTPVCADDRA